MCSPMQSSLLCIRYTDAYIYTFFSFFFSSQPVSHLILCSSFLSPCFYIESFVISLHQRIYSRSTVIYSFAVFLIGFSHLLYKTQRFPWIPKQVLSQPLLIHRSEHEVLISTLLITSVRFSSAMARFCCTASARIHFSLRFLMHAV